MSPVSPPIVSIIATAVALCLSACSADPARSTAGATAASAGRTGPAAGSVDAAAAPSDGVAAPPSHLAYLAISGALVKLEGGVFTNVALDTTT